MNWDAVSAISEIIASIAVVISVVYLAVQIRHSSQVSERQAFEGAVSNLLQNVFDDVASNEEVANIYHQGLKDFDGLSPVEKDRFRAIMLKIIIGHEPAVEPYINKSAVLKSTVLDAIHHTLLHHLLPPGGRQWWEQDGKNWVTSDFRDYLDKLISENANMNNNDVGKNS